MSKPVASTSAAVQTPTGPRFASAWAALVYTLCAMTLAWPVLAGNFLVEWRSDQYRAGFAFREFAAETMKATGGFPQWNPYLFGGMPYVSAMHGDIFYPTFLLRLILPVDLAMSWGMVLHFILCGLATYWFLRIAAHSAFWPAIVGGMAYMMAGFVSSLVSAGHDGKLFVNALFPVTLIALTWCICDAKAWAWGLLALVVGLALLTPHPQLAQYLLLGGGAWALFLAFAPGVGDARLPAGQAFTRLGLALGAVIVGFAISAIQYVPVMEYTPWSPRAGGQGYDFATQFSFPIEELFNLYLPQFSGLLDKYWGRNGIHFHSEYAGVLVLMLAGAGITGVVGSAAKRFQRFWIATGFVALLWALGGSTPFYQVIYAIVPGTKFFRAPSTIFFIVAFATAMLAAAGTARVLERRVPRGYLIGWGVAGAVVTLLAVSGGLTSLAHSLAVAPQLADRVDAGAAELKIGALRSLVFVIVGAGLILAIGTERLRGWQAGLALTAFGAFDLWTIERHYWGFVPPAAQVYAADATTEYLKRLPAPARVLTNVDPNFPYTPNDPFLTGDALMGHRVPVTYGYHGNELGRYQLFEQPEMAGNPTTWAMTNTRFLLTNNDSIGIQGLTRVAGPVVNAAGTTVTLYELPGEQSLAWVVPVATKYADNAVTETLRAPNFPARSVALMATDANIPDVTLAAIPEPLKTSVAVKSYAPGRISLELSEPAAAGSALVVAENYFPGWTASVDGKAVKVERTNLTIMGVPLEAGARRVELQFASQSFARGKAITQVALAMAVLAMLVGLALARRGRPSVGTSTTREA
ncbi:MAG: YfhO family protein [Gemmatimonadetes bacterium]|nr:YfhO family protein [Gemmatimonadota bacterium]